MTYHAVGFGAINLDKLYQVNKIAREDDESFIYDLKMSCGGSAANTLIGLSRLGLRTALIGKTAQDQEGEHLLANLKDEGVDIKGVTKSSEGRSGTVMGFVDKKGERALYVDSGVNDQINLEEIDLNLAFNTKVLHLTSFVGGSKNAQEELLDTLPPEITVSLDPGRIYAEYGAKSLDKILKRTNILLVNLAELKILSENKYKIIEDEIKSLRKFHIDIIVVKLGDKGCYATDGESSYKIDPFPVKCRDTTGAGDAFNAGFLYGYLEGKTLKESCIIGNYVAACCVEDYGGINGLPVYEKLNKNLNEIG